MVLVVWVGSWRSCCIGCSFGPNHHGIYARQKRTESGLDGHPLRLTMNDPVASCSGHVEGRGERGLVSVKVLPTGENWFAPLGGLDFEGSGSKS